MDAYKRLCILNHVQDAKLFLSKEQSMDECLVCSTHASVNDLLKTKNIDCIHLSSLIEHDFVFEQAKKVDHFVNELLCFIDEALAEKISDILGLIAIDYFYTLYKYSLKYGYVSYLQFKLAINRLCETHAINSIMFYSVPEIPNLDNISELIINDLDRKDRNVEIIANTTQYKPETVKYWCGLIKRLLQLPVNDLLSKMSKRIYREVGNICPVKLSHEKRTVILLESLYDLKFLKEQQGFNEEYNVIVWPYLDIPKLYGVNIDLKADKMSAIAMLLDHIDLESKLSHLPKDLILFGMHILEQFRKKMYSNLLPLIYVDQLFQRYGVDLCVWGNPPVQFSKSLVCEYLLKRGVRIVGMQHGASYMVQYSPRHFESDFSRCTHYFSYGFDENTARLAYPDKELACNVIPTGSYKELEFVRSQSVDSKNKKAIDILFPITNCASVFNGHRINAAQLAMYQNQLLDLLEGITDLRIVVKPSPNYNAANCAVCERIKRLRNVQLSKLKLMAFLEHYSPRLIVLEYPSTPLFEVVGLDVDILLMSYPTIPFFTEALDLLRKRVHIFEDIEDMKTAILKYSKGQITKLRNKEFYHKYVYRKNAKEVILKTIDTLMKEN